MCRFYAESKSVGLVLDDEVGVLPLFVLQMRSSSSWFQPRLRPRTMLVLSERGGGVWPGDPVGEARQEEWGDETRGEETETETEEEEDEGIDLIDGEPGDTATRSRRFDLRVGELYMVVLTGLLRLVADLTNGYWSTVSEADVVIWDGLARGRRDALTSCSEAY